VRQDFKGILVQQVQRDQQVLKDLLVTQVLEDLKGLKEVRD